MARAYPEGELHLVMDNYAAHKHKSVRDWLATNPRFVAHFTPTHASWMNLVEVWFGIVERQAIRRGVFKSVKDLNTKIRAVPGVISTETLVYLKLVKQQYNWGTR